MNKNRYPFILRVILLWSLFCTWCVASDLPTLLISGQVVDTQGQPISGAEVVVSEQVFSGLRFIERWQADPIRSDERGRFQITVPALCQRDVYVVARKTGYALSWDVVNAIRNSWLSQKQVFLVMQKPEVLAGRVVDSAGKPVIQAEVTALAESRCPGRIMGQMIFTPKEWFGCMTKSKGQFKFDCFGKHQCAKLYVHAPEYDCAYYFYPHKFANGFAAGRTDVELSLPVEVPVKGRVVDLNTKKPVSGARLVIQKDRMKWKVDTWDYAPVYTTTDAQGGFSVSLPLGPHVIQLDTTSGQELAWTGWSRCFQLREGRRVPTLNLTVQKGNLVHIQAFDVVTNEPLENARFTMLKHQNRPVYTYHEVSTDIQGKASFRVPAGTYRLMGDLIHEFRTGFEEEVVVKRGQTLSLKCPMTRKPGWGGQVVDDQGKAVSDVLVRVQPSGDEACTDANGCFTVCTNYKSPSGLMLWARDVNKNLIATADIVDDQTRTTLTLQPGLCIRGRITDRQGVAIPATHVELWINGPGFLSPLGAETLTDRQGLYEFAAVPPCDDTYSYRVNINVVGFGPHRYLPIPIQGKAGETVQLDDIKLYPCDKTVSGIAFNANGTPYANGVICVGRRNRFSQPSISNVTDAQGHYSFSGVCDGPLQIQADMGSSPTGCGFAKAWGGDRDVRVTKGKELYHERQVSLVGKPLMPIATLGCDFSIVEGKPVLLCLVDLEQRPSRQFLNQNKTELSSLNQKGIQIEFIQASLMKPDKRKSLQTSYRVPSTLHAMKGPTEELRKDWGIKALPWMVLADRDHLVVAEGPKLDLIKKTLLEIQ